MAAGADDVIASLRALGVHPEQHGIWLSVGNPTHVAGWKLHLSVTVLGAGMLLDRVLPYLARREALFKVAAGRDVIVQLAAGNYGETQIGKVITVYPRDDSEAVALARELTGRTQGIVGPRIATDLHLGAAVYARYGAVRPRIVHDRFGEPSELIPDGHGNWVPDLRPVPFSCPPGIVIPFPVGSAAQSTSRRNEGRLLSGRYLVTDVLRPGIAGSVLRAIDLRNKRKPVICVIKQARPHCSEDHFGRDRRFRLRHEGAMLEKLRGVTGVLPAGDYFEEDDIGYLPVAYVPGRSLGEIVVRAVTGRRWLQVRSDTRQRLLDHAAQLTRRLRAAHARGVIHRDVAPANVWIGDDDRVHLIDWECAHAVDSQSPAFRLGTPGFSDRSSGRQVPTPRDDWQACGRVLAFVLTGLDPAAFLYGSPGELGARLRDLTGLRNATLIDALARALADEPSDELDAASVRGALAAARRGRTAERQSSAAPLFTSIAHESVLAAGFEDLCEKFRFSLDRLQTGCRPPDASTIDVQGGIAGMLYVLSAAHAAKAALLDTTLAQRAAHLLMADLPVSPDLPGLVHGRAGRALAVAAAVQAGCAEADDSLRMQLAHALGGRLDWPDFTHGAAGQGFAALASGARLGSSALASSAAACAHHLVRTQEADGAWTLPAGSMASGERYTGFAHGAAGIMGFLGRYAARAEDAGADAAWRRAEAWLISRARRGRGAKWQWPLSDSQPAPGTRWCHGAPGIALGWLCVARAQGTGVIAEEYLRGALEAIPRAPRGDCLGQCHGLAGVGEVHLEAHRVLQEEQWRERSADIARVLVALFRKRSRQPWHYPAQEPTAEADGLMLGTAGILHFLLRHRYPLAVTCAPLTA